MLKAAQTRPPIDEFRQFLADRMGLHFPKEKEKELLGKLERIAKALDMVDLKECVKFLSDDKQAKKHIPLLAKELTVGETYFFRNAPAFQAIEKEIFPEIISHNASRGKKIKIWSAASCSGEEPYSIAILLDKLLPQSIGWDIHILGTDINHDFIEKAKKGLYKEWSFRDTETSFKETYFTEQGPREYLLKEKFRNMVKFDSLNLVENTYPCPLTDIYEMDLILCNNVLIYFTPLIINRVVNRLANSLREGGWLMVTSVEAPFVEHRHLIPQKVGRAYAFRKCTNYKKPDPILPPKPMIQAPPPKQEPKRTPIVLKPVPEAAPPSRPSEDLKQLIKSFANKGEVDKARELCEMGLGKDDLNPSLYYYYGMTLQELGNFEPAINAYKSALFLDPTFIMCHFALGSLLLLRDQPKEAKKHFRNTLELLKAVVSSDTVPESDDLTAEKLVYLTENLMRSV